MSMPNNFNHFTGKKKKFSKRRRKKRIKVKRQHRNKYRKGKNSALKVTDPNGQKAGQQLLNEFVEQLALDLPKFMEASSAEKAKILLQIIGIGPQLTQLEQQEKELYQERLYIGRTADQKEKFAKEQPYYTEAPKDLISASELIRQQQEILARNGENQRKREQLHQLEQRYQRINEQMANLLAEQKKVESDLEIARKSALDLHDESTEELEQNISNIEEINRKVRANLDKEKAEDDAKTYRDQYNSLTKDLEDVRDKKAELLNAAELPLPELSVKEGELIYNAGKYEATITAPGKSSYTLSGHCYPVTVKATDDAGNTTTKTDSDATLGSSLKLQVKEKVAPVIAITAPTAGSYIINSKPAITFKITDDDSGVNPTTIGVTIDSGSKITGDSITKKAVSGGYECTYTPDTALSDGSHTVKVDASDYDGNAAVQKSVTFKIDTVPPTLSITSPVDDLVTNQAACTVKGITNDVTSSPVTVTIKLNSGSAEAVTVGSDGSFSKALTLAAGSNTITIVARDSAGKTTTITRTVKLDTTPPTIKSITLTPNPVDAGKTFVISVEVTD